MTSDGGMTTAAEYPREDESDVVLRDGSTVRVRPVRTEDGPDIRAFLEGLSPESIGFRFFGVPNLTWATSWSIDVDYADRYGLVAVKGEEILAHAAYIRTVGDRAEVAFVVADAWQGQGISTIMLGQLAGVAERHGITTFTAEVLPTNHKMIEVFRQSGFPVDLHSTPDAIKIELPTSLSEEALLHFEERERTAAVAAVRSFLEPRSVAVIGASRRRGTIGGEILRNILSAEFQGALYAVNPRADVVQSLPAYPSIGAIPHLVDLAVIVVPAEEVNNVARECAAAGVRALLIISAGFGEAGEQGVARQHELIEICRTNGIRIIGPNCLGLLNTDPAVSLNANFAPHRAIHGRVGFLSQSGGLGIAIIEAAGRIGLGLSSFVSVGNKADLSGNDFLSYWEQDPNTDVALLYLESFGNPRKFARIAPRIAQRKPIVAVKSGRSSAGARATSSHTGALISASDVTVDALFEQAGVIRTDTLNELFDVAALLSKQSVPRGDRVVIITNAGGPGIMCADACQADGVKVPELSAQLQSELAGFLPPTASLGNPIDMIATASGGDYRRTIETVTRAGACDAVIAIYVPPLVTPADEVAAGIRAASEAAPEVTMAGVFMTSEPAPAELGDDSTGVPAYPFPEDAARAVALAARHGRWRSEDHGEPRTFEDTRLEEAAAIISHQLAEGEGWLSPERVTALLRCYGLPLISTQTVPDADAAVRAAAELGGPVAIKAVATGLIHKSDAGGVKLGLDGEDAVRAAVGEIEASVREAGHTLDGLVIQPMASDGVELIVGVVNDRSFGPVVACGGGGTTAELIKDVAVRITPISDLDAHQMLRSLKTFPLLTGYRGAKKCDLGSIEEVLLRVSAMVEAHPAIVELDCNPLIARPDGAVIVDARVRVETAPAAPPIASLGPVESV